MNKAKWQRAKEIYFAALDEDESGWEAFVSEQCGSDADLRAEVLTYLR